jgi:hypothetical protein
MKRPSAMPIPVSAMSGVVSTSPALSSSLNRWASSRGWVARRFASSPSSVCRWTSGSPRRGAPSTGSSRRLRTERASQSSMGRFCAVLLTLSMPGGVAVGLGMAASPAGKCSFLAPPRRPAILSSVLLRADATGGLSAASGDFLRHCLLLATPACAPGNVPAVRDASRGVKREERRLDGGAFVE